MTLQAEQRGDIADQPWNGVLRRTYEVHCLGCEQAVLGLPGDYAEAERELRAPPHYWRKVGGRWHCADCAGMKRNARHAG